MVRGTAVGGARSAAERACARPPRATAPGNASKDRGTIGYHARRIREATGRALGARRNRC
jgi:hypothetical protein